MLETEITSFLINRLSSYGISLSNVNQKYDKVVCLTVCQEKLIV